MCDSIEYGGAHDRGRHAALGVADRLEDARELRRAALGVVGERRPAVQEERGRAVAAAVTGQDASGDGDLEPLLAHRPTLTGSVEYGCHATPTVLAWRPPATEGVPWQRPQCSIFSLSMNADAVEASSLDPKTLMLVRIAALVAMDAPPVSYLLNLEVAGEVEVDAEDVQGVLAAVAPIVGTPRVVSAASKMVRALGIKLDLEELEAKAPAA